MVHENQQSVTALMAKIPSPQVRRLIPIAAALLLALLASQAISLLNPMIARAYSCGTGSGSGHCYGINFWSMSPGIRGAGTDILVVHLNCSSCWSISETGFVDNEIWLNDYNNSGCSGNVCWVEAGYWTVSGAFSTTVNYFWADNRPGGGLNVHTLAQVPSADYSDYAEFYIWQNFGWSNKWEVDIDSPNYYYSNYSTSNSMVADDINIGQELAGTSGASAPTAYFTDNWYYDSNLNFDYQSYEGAVTSNNPPHAAWDTNPAYSLTGGVFKTWCC
jgi:hypothetical protein